MTRKSKIPDRAPLREFDYRLVEERLDGLLINIDRDLQRRTGYAERTHNLSASRCLTLLVVIIRFATNSYRAIRYVVAEKPEDPNRKPNYSLILAPVNRQLLDLFFSLVFMFDDFEARSLQYQRAGWRELTEEYQRFKTHFAKDPEWKAFFIGGKEAIEYHANLLGITPAERKKPALIPYWKHPFELKEKNTRSRKFLRWLDKWLYGDTSAQAHLSFGGLLSIAPMLVAELAGGQSQALVEERMIHMYRYQHFSRTALVVLSIATEIEIHCKLGNQEQAAYLWKMFVEHVPEGKEMFKERYETLLPLTS